MAAKRYTGPIFIQPVEWIDAQMAMAGRKSGPPTYRSAVEYLCTPCQGHKPEDLLRRYEEISANTTRICHAPGKGEILQSIFWPLRHARSAYVLADYLATIALCGVVCEVLTLLLFEMRPVTIGGKRMSKSRERRIFGKKVRDLSQSRRIDLLQGLGAIGADAARSFGRVRELRNKHIHDYLSSHEEAQQDAVEVYRLTNSLIVEALGCGFTTGAFTYSPDLFNLLLREGVLKESDFEDVEEADAGAQKDDGPEGTRQSRSP